MNISCICFNTNTDEDRSRLAVLTKRLLKKFNQGSNVLDALVATALVDDRAAAHWLVNHAEDPSLSGGNPREFFLLLCPVNELASRFDDFWTGYRGARGWCPAMEFMPHAPLIRPFEAMSGSLLDVYHAFNTVSRFYAQRCPAGDFQLTMPPADIAETRVAFQLSRQTSVEAVLVEAAAKFVDLLAAAQVRAEALPPPYKLSLCQDFMQAQQPQIVREVVSQFAVDEATRRVTGGASAADTAWQLRLYSRDVRLRNDLSGETHAVYRVPQECLAEEPAYAGNCLACSAGDRVAVVAPAAPLRHGWALGLNCETGQLGHFMISGAQRVPCSSVWTLHKVSTFGSIMPPSSPLCNSAASSSSFGCWPPLAFSRQSSIGGAEESPQPPPPPPPNGCGGGSHRQQKATTVAADSSGSSSDSVQPQPQQQPLAASGTSSTSTSSASSSPSPKSPQPQPPPQSPTSPPPSSATSGLGKSRSFASFRRGFGFGLLGSSADAAGTAAAATSGRGRRPLQLHVMRHGERLDSAVGFNWFAKAFDQKGVFANRFDLNIPELLPTRPPDDFNYDAPLTLVGQFVSYQIGESLARAGVRYSYAYSSPALRCIQTAHHLLLGAGQPDIAVRVEPHLNEFLYDDCVQMPVFMTPTELRASGYNVDCDYKAHTTLVGFDKQNTPEKYQKRLCKVLLKIVDSTKKLGGPVLLVGHRTTLEFCPVLLMERKCCARHLCIPYNAMLCLSRAEKKGSWSLANCPAPGFSISEHGRFDGSHLLAP